MTTKFVVIDLETTGNSPKKGDKIIQFAAVVIENGKIVEQFSSLVNPQQPIPLFIEELTGLNDEMVEDAPIFSEIAPNVLKMLDGAYFVAHNVLFDLTFLQEELIESGYEGFYGPVIDTVELARILFPTADSYKLNDLAFMQGLEHSRPHQADSDAYVTAELLQLFISRLHTLPQATLRQLLKLSGGLKSDISLLLDEYVLAMERTVEELPAHLELYRGIALRKQDEYGVTTGDSDTVYPASHDSKEQLFKMVFPTFEKRLGQFDMMDAVYHSFLEDKHAVIEAGTGVGKSLAYLLPGAIFSRENNEPIIISTFTIQLQEQLLANDIPLLQKMLPFQLRTVLLKGRNHYISLSKFEQTLKDDEDNYDTSLTKMQILVWLTETKTGDIDELNLSSGGLLYWNKVKNDEAVILQNKSWMQYDFYLRARKAAEKADIIITNHSLLLADLVSEHSILPKNDYVIIDEGHHFEKAAGKYFGYSLDYLSVRLLLSRCGLMEQKQLLYQLQQLLEEIKWNQNNEEVLHTFELNQLISELQFEMDELFRMISSFVKKKAKRSYTNRMNCSLQNYEDTKEGKAIFNSGERFSFLLYDLISYFEKCLSGLESESEHFTIEQRRVLTDISSLQLDLKGTREKIKNVLLNPSSDYVTWVEMDARAVQNATTVYAQPVAISDHLSEQFFHKKKSVIVTSATLTVNNSFDYIINELGLNTLPLNVERISSPFNYKEQVQLLVANDLPEVNAVPLDEYVAAISEHIISIAEATSGRMLILFTSHEMLRKTHDLMKESGLLEDYVLIAQGITAGSRTRLTRNFQRFEKAILLGTSSFWEGVDIPGEDLSCLIIVRLPFSAPDDPLTEAKCARIKEIGGNPFSSHSLPEAVIRFKQGFGRLIRSSKDRGIVVVFDKRIISTRYGKAFLESIPEVPIRRNNINEMVELIEGWL
ncbi:ATP-dependent DNA helicase DinG [Cytobacillus sp. FJAT-54145]|uniref:3'-5' exonuclease DinG n=1 Tax=Cytobacillus spartinae TaxID=3299023 RepID=A0ABW6KDG5_9BACI